MAVKNQASTLLHKLLALYSLISTRLLHKRINADHESGQVENKSNIPTLLSEHIYERVASSISDSEKSDGSNQEIDSRGTESIDQPTRKNHGGIFKSLAGLFKHFRKRRTEAVLAPHLSEKLKKTVWDHIHKTLRFSHLGEMEHAKLHADITNNALKEAAHYMSSEEYIEFTSEIEEHLIKIREQGL